MANVIKVCGRTVRCVYDDRFRPLLEALGHMEITRATDVEFEPSTGMWVARLRETGEEIARSRERAECIRAEVEFLERRLVQ
jgi:hypothetical protein